MRELLPTLAAWHDAGQRSAVATVVEVRRSAPREPGAAMAVHADGAVVGSVSGGCVEGAVFDEAQKILTGAAPRVVSYGITDEEALAVGLTCGGEIDVLLEPVEDWVGAVAAAVQHEEPVAVATVTAGPAALGAKLVVAAERIDGTLGSEGLDAAVRDDARGMLAQGKTGLRHYGPRGQRRQDDVAVFIHTFAPPPRMLVFGAIDYAAAVARVGKFLGYKVTVCDARPVFATRERFPDADEVVVAWPHRYLERAPVDDRTVICVLTHDPKFDVPVLELALRSPAGYVGAMGSRRTHADRLERLRQAGLTEDELARLRSPIGLDLGARTPEETAVSVAAEIIQQRWGGSGRPLEETDGRIHEPSR